MLSSGIAFAGDEPRACNAQHDLTRLAYALPHTAKRLSDRAPLTIVALGSSSTAGAGASSPAASYPSRLAAVLQQAFPSSVINVLNRGVNGEEARDMLDRFERNIAAEQPDLVLWQVGTNAVLRDNPVNVVASAIHEGVVRIKGAGRRRNPDRRPVRPERACKARKRAHAEPACEHGKGDEGRPVPALRRDAALARDPEHPV
jgi:lysophospholipase L1-like esterase